MSVTPRAVRAALIPIAMLLWLVAATPVAAHAELEASDPEDGAVLTIPPDEVIATFTEGLAGNSSMELRTIDGSTVATTGVDDDDRRMVIRPASQLAPGDYEVRWQAFGADGHLWRGRFMFTVLRPTPVPAASADATGGASPPADPTSAPTPAPSAEPGPDAASSTQVLVPVAAALVVLGGLGLHLLRRRRGLP